MNTHIIAVNYQKKRLTKALSLLQNVMNASHRSASDMTKALGELGCGNKGNGIAVFGRMFQVDGMIKGSFATLLIISTGIGIK